MYKPGVAYGKVDTWCRFEMHLGRLGGMGLPDGCTFSDVFHSWETCTFFGFRGQVRCENGYLRLRWTDRQPNDRGTELTVEYERRVAIRKRGRDPAAYTRQQFEEIRQEQETWAAQNARMRELGAMMRALRATYPAESTTTRGAYRVEVHYRESDLEKTQVTTELTFRGPLTPEDIQAMHEAWQRIQTKPKPGGGPSVYEMLDHGHRTDDLRSAQTQRSPDGHVAPFHAEHDPHGGERDRHGRNGP